MTTCDRYRPGSGVDATPKTPRAGLRRQTHVACLICTSRIHAPLSPRDTAQGLWTGTIRRRRVSTSNARKSVTPPKKAGAVRAAARRRGPRLRRRRGPSRSCPGPSSARAHVGALRARRPPAPTRQRSAASAAPRRRRTTMFENAAPPLPQPAPVRASARPELQTRRRAPSRGRCRLVACACDFAPSLESPPGIRKEHGHDRQESTNERSRLPAGVFSSVLQPASSELRRANVRDSRLGSLALKETPTIAQ